jgi:hypothetical protein
LSGAWGRTPGRFYGSIGTLLILVALSVLLLVRSFMA